MTEPPALWRESPTAAALLRSVMNDLLVLSAIEHGASGRLRGFIACCRASVEDASRAHAAGDSSAWAMIHSAGRDVTIATEDAVAEGLLPASPG